MGKIWAAAKATKKTVFDTIIKGIKENNAEAGLYLRNVNPKLLAASYFPKSRYGCKASNSAESLHSWMEPLREKRTFIT